MQIRYETAEDFQYVQYLEAHIDGVYRAFLSIKNKLMEDTDNFPNISELESQIRQHDESKTSEAEWIPYRNYFYPTEECPKDEEAFDVAWLHHQHNNPHHWQHWTLLRDSGETVALDMPINYVIEMLCDWHSFSIKSPDSTAYSWWKANKSKMKLSKKTKDLVNKYVEYFKEPIQ